MVELFIILILLIELIIFIVYGIHEIIQIIKRRKNTISVDTKMLNYGRVFSWVAVIGMTYIKKMQNQVYYVIFSTLLLVIYIYGSRLYLLSFKIKKENTKSFYYRIDQWSLSIYREYLEPLWNDKESNDL